MVEMRAVSFAISDIVSSSVAIDCGVRDHRSCANASEEESRKFSRVDFGVDERFCNHAKRPVSTRLTLEQSVSRIHE